MKSEVERVANVVLTFTAAAGAVDVVHQLDAGSFKFAKRISTAPGVATVLFVPELKRYCLAVPQTGTQSAELRDCAAGE